MKIAATYSFNAGEEHLRSEHSELISEIETVIELIDAESCKLKKPRGAEIERARRVNEKYFYSPIHINALFDYYFFHRGWEMKPRLQTNERTRYGYREMDFIKDQVGLEVQIGKYAFLTYDIIAKMVIFRNIGLINSGVEICPMASMLPYLSSGIGAFEQVRWDLEYRGVVKEFDVPVLLIGIEPELLHTMRENDEAAYRIPQPTVQLNRYPSLNEKTLQRVRETGLKIG